MKTISRHNTLVKLDNPDVRLIIKTLTTPTKKRRVVVESEILPSEISVIIELNPKYIPTSDNNISPDKYEEYKHKILNESLPYITNNFLHMKLVDNSLYGVTCDYTSGIFNHFIHILYTPKSPEEIIKKFTPRNKVLRFDPKPQSIFNYYYIKREGQKNELI